MFYLLKRDYQLQPEVAGAGISGGRSQHPGMCPGPGILLSGTHLF